VGFEISGFGGVEKEISIFLYRLPISSHFLYLGELSSKTHQESFLWPSFFTTLSISVP
jgi:hypothetical protein